MLELENDLLQEESEISLLQKVISSDKGGIAYIEFLEAIIGVHCSPAAILEEDMEEIVIKQIRTITNKIITNNM